jgi:glucose-6-phosphate 1-dehydrogenase
MASKVTEVVIEFNRVPHLFFQLTAEDQIVPNLITMRIQPDEGIALRFGAKVPGPQMHIRQVQMNFSYAEAFKAEPATAYETLLLDAMAGDPTLFNRADAVELAWTAIEPLLDIWTATRPFQPFPNYEASSWGPAASEALLARDGRSWHNRSAASAGASQTRARTESGGETRARSHASADGRHGNDAGGHGKDRPIRSEESETQRSETRR